MASPAQVSDKTRFDAAILAHFLDERSKDNGADLTESQLKSLVQNLWEWAGSQAKEARQVRILAGEETALKSSRTRVLEVVGPDIPFLVDSILSECSNMGAVADALFHPIIVDQDDHRISVIQVHLLNLTPAEADRLVKNIRDMLSELQIVVSDHQAMLARMRTERDELAALKHLPTDDRDEAVAFLDWLSREHFVFLGARTYEFEVGKDGRFLREEPIMVEKSNLGLLRNEELNVLTRGAEPTVLTGAAQEFLQLPDPLIIAKSTMVSRIHRRVRADYVGVKHYDAAGRVNGETRFLGLFTAEAYDETARSVPLIRKRVREVIERSGARPGGHSAKALSNILETWPRDELFQTDTEMLAAMAQGVLHLQERPKARLFLRRDRFDRFLSAIVYAPRDAYDSDFRQSVGQLLIDAFDASLLRFEPRFGSEQLARVLFILELPTGHPEPDLADLERQIADLAARWHDGFRDALLTSDLRAHARDGALVFEDAFNAAYREAFLPVEALTDVSEIAELSAEAPVRVRAYRREKDAPCVIRAKVYSRGKSITLSESVPVFENMGLVVDFETGYRVRPPRKPRPDAPDDYWIHDVLMRTETGRDVNLAETGVRFQDAFVAVWMKRVENDGFNKLVFTISADWKDVDLLRGLAAYRRQSGMDPAAPSQIRALNAYPAITQNVLWLFKTLFDPSSDETLAAREAAGAMVRSRIREQLSQVPSLEDDRVLRRMTNLIFAIQRTNFYQPERTCPLAFKIASRDLEDLPKPKPFREIFVASPVVEGVHIRFGPVARGGLRWSDRQDDFRTEVLGLVKAQQVKNAVIVPVGSKGGFVPKRLPPEGGREAIRDAGINAYRAFISALLSVTDNLIDGEVRHPDQTIARDGTDPYLVVAADKGTATFSDIANEISVCLGFWLGDAFASGGSAGYDHKAMGITARGAWEAVKRHFHEMGKDIQSEPFTVIGVGDMSGDVFGNGMLLSEKIQLKAAFNHLHIFVDPDPIDTDRCFAERQRLFDLPRSSWSEYDVALISEGGGVFERSAKAIPLSQQMKDMAGLTADEVTPDELIHALLKSEAELLWFGGIGTYVKSDAETSADVGDRANDAIRVNADELKVKVIGEGANLGITQSGRIAFALNGGRVNTDAIDNSAGVDSSDHEVNIKILLSEAMRRGQLPRGERNTLLASMTDDVARHVLTHNISQTGALSLAEASAAEDHFALERLMVRLERRGVLDRDVEGLPSTEDMASRAEAGQWLTRPEIAVLLAWSKIVLFDDIVASDLPDDPVFVPVLKSYFPTALNQYADTMLAHRLHREIIATVLSNRIIDFGGPAMMLELREVTGAQNADIVKAFEVALSAAKSADIRAMAVESGVILPADVELILRRAHVTFIKAATAQIVRTQMDGETLNLIARYQKGFDALIDAGDSMVSELGHKRADREIQRLVSAGVPRDLATATARLIFLEAGARLIDAAAVTGKSPETASAAFGLIAQAARHDQLRAGALAVLPNISQWDRLATQSQLESLLDAEVAVVKALLDADQSPEDYIRGRAQDVELLSKSLASLDLEGSWSFSKFSLAADSVRRFLSGA